MVVSVFSTDTQAQAKKQPLSLVEYNENVEQPLTSKELSQIKEVYGIRTKELILDKPQRLKDVKNLLRNRVVIKKYSNPRDQKACPKLSEVEMFDYYVKDLKRDLAFNPATFNPLKYKFNIYGLSGEMYRVDNTDYFIIIKSQHQK